MLALKLKIKETTNDERLEEYQRQFTGLFYDLYSNAELLEDKGKKQELLEKFPLFDASMFESVTSDVRTKLKQHQTNIKKKRKEIKELEEMLEENDFEKGIHGRRSKFKVIKKLAKKKRNLEKDSCFGGKATLRSITKFSQQIQCLTKRLVKEEDSEKINEMLVSLDEKKVLLSDCKQEFQDNRMLGIYVIGRALDKGNRKVSFDLNNNKITFKPSKGDHIEIVMEDVGTKRRRIMKRLQAMAENKTMPLSVRITNDEVIILYDEMLLAGFSFNDVECKKKQKLCSTDEEKKHVFIEFKREQEGRMLLGKLPNRWMAVDLNPFDIGITVADVVNGKIVFIHKERISLELLGEKLGLPSHHKKQKKQNNKRKHEIKHVWKHIFGLAKHFQCSRFVCEELELNEKPGNKEANRKVCNLWHLTLTKNLITKWCNELGIIKIEVNPAYSSFIGNIIHKDDFDCIASAKEILRRGVNRFKKGGSLHPPLSEIAVERLTHLLQENADSVGNTWQTMFKAVSLAKLRYRNVDPSLLGAMKDSFLNSKHSMTTQAFAHCHDVYVC